MMPANAYRQEDKWFGSCCWGQDGCPFASMLPLLSSSPGLTKDPSAYGQSGGYGHLWIKEGCIHWLGNNPQPAQLGDRKPVGRRLCSMCTRLCQLCSCAPASLHSSTQTVQAPVKQTVKAGVAEAGCLQLQLTCPC